ncbi:hypothetical protein NQZ68_005261 [Dissostichus eleginoides]|nr:hypothetical protein NQZ68_005261 [Dissostichus eleginoides]
MTQQQLTDLVEQDPAKSNNAEPASAVSYTTVRRKGESGGKEEGFVNLPVHLETVPSAELHSDASFSPKQTGIKTDIESTSCNPLLDPYNLLTPFPICRQDGTRGRSGPKSHVLLLSLTVALFMPFSLGQRISFSVFH